MLKKHPENLRREKVVYGGCINYDVSKLHRECGNDVCKKRRIFASSLEFSECRGSYTLAR